MKLKNEVEKCVCNFNKRNQCSQSIRNVSRDAWLVFLSGQSSIVLLLQFYIESKLTPTFSCQFMEMVNSHQCWKYLKMIYRKKYTNTEFQRRNNETVSPLACSFSLAKCLIQYTKSSGPHDIVNYFYFGFLRCYLHIAIKSMYAFHFRCLVNMNYFKNFRKPKQENTHTY